MVNEDRKSIIASFQEGECAGAWDTARFDGRRWDVCVTDRRVILVSTRIVASNRRLDIPIAKVTEVETESGWVSNSVTLVTPAKVYRLESLTYPDRFASAVFAALSERPQA